MALGGPDGAERTDRPSRAAAPASDAPTAASVGAAMQTDRPGAISLADYQLLLDGCGGMAGCSGAIRGGGAEAEEDRRRSAAGPAHDRRTDPGGWGHAGPRLAVAAQQQQEDLPQVGLGGWLEGLTDRFASGGPWAWLERLTDLHAQEHKCDRNGLYPGLEVQGHRRGLLLLCLGVGGVLSRKRECCKEANAGVSHSLSHLSLLTRPACVSHEH
jgi:hypothetical protein